MNIIKEDEHFGSTVQDFQSRIWQSSVRNDENVNARVLSLKMQSWGCNSFDTSTPHAKLNAQSSGWELDVWFEHLENFEEVVDGLIVAREIWRKEEEIRAEQKEQDAVDRILGKTDAPTNKEEMELSISDISKGASNVARD